MQLSQVNVNDCVKVKSMNLDQALTRRLKTLGFLTNTTIQVIEKKGKGTMIIMVRGTRLAIGASISQCIEVSYE